MADLNRMNSPMLPYEESLEESKEAANRKIKALRDRQYVRSPFLIGSIEEVSRKIGKLDRKLQSYTELICESRASDYPEFVYEARAKAEADQKANEKYQTKERDEKEIKQFAGLFSIQSVIGLTNKAAVKKLHGIDSKISTPKEDGKPKFVEICQYPGYDKNEPTPLPAELQTFQIYSLVCTAQFDLRKKPTYRKRMEALLFSKMSYHILMDAFWWIFLEKFQSNVKSQERLFDRLADNYVKLLTEANNLTIREPFFKSFPTLLSQAVYATFCHAFPDSWRQFGDDFKEYVAGLIYQWFVGIKPAPLSFKKWNLEVIEPANVRLREEILNKNKSDKKPSLLSFENMDALASKTSSQTTLNQGSTSSLHSNVGKVKGVSFASTAKKAKNGSTETLTIQNVSDAQKSILSKSKEGYRDNKEQVLSPIFEGSDNGKMDENSSPYWNRAYKVEIESHPIGRGSEFSKCVFNVTGQSPLVAHYLRKNNLRTEAGCDIKVSRTEIQKLPQSTETYSDLIRESFKQINKTRKVHESHFEKSKKEIGLHLKDFKKEQKEQRKKEEKLLKSHREIKRISNLIVLENRVDPEQ